MVLSAPRAPWRSGRYDDWSPYQERIYATIYHMTSNHEDANDLAQEHSSKGFRRSSLSKGGQTFIPGFIGSPLIKRLTFSSSARTRAQLSLDDMDFNAEQRPGLGGAHFLKKPPPRNQPGRAAGKLNTAMQKLSEPHRIVVTLHDIQGMSHDEIAEIVDCNIGTVRSRLFYARQQLQAYLSDYLK